MKRSALSAALGSACAVLALVSGLMLGGCSSGPDAEELIREDITSTLDELKNMDDAAIQEYADALGDVGLGSYGIENSELIKAMVDGFDYTIDSVTVEEDTATATVTVTSKSMGELSNIDPDAMAEAFMSDPDFETIISDTDATNAWAGEYIMGIIDQIEPSEKTLEFTYSKTDDGWEIDSSASDEVSRIFV